MRTKNNEFYIHIDIYELFHKKKERKKETAMI